MVETLQKDLLAQVALGWLCSVAVVHSDSLMVLPENHVLPFFCKYCYGTGKSLCAAYLECEVCKQQTAANGREGQDLQCHERAYGTGPCRASQNSQLKRVMHVI